MSELNLIPYHLKKKQDKSKQMMIYYKKGLIGVIILCFLIGIPKLIAFGINVQEIYYKNIVENLNIKTIDQQINEMKKEIEDYKFYINKVKTLTENQKLTMQRIRDVEKYIPAEVFFQDLVYQGDSMIINGITLNINAIDGFGATLELSKAYKNVRISSISKSGKDSGLGEYYEFTVVLDY